MTETGGSCPKCGYNGWVLNSVKGRLVDVCIGCGFSEPSQVKRGKRKGGDRDE